MNMSAPTSSPLSDRERELSAIITAYNEVTDRLKSAHDRLHDEVARLRDELRKKNEELRRSERLAALGEMAAGLAHEIRNPLGGIALYASMLHREARDTDTVMSAAGRISDGVRGLERLVTEILDFAQERAPQRQLMTLGMVLDVVETSIEPWEAQSGGQFVVDDSARGMDVWADRDQLVQVLLNLVMNGLQAVGDKGSVTLTAAPRDGGVEIDISDDGPGIDEADLTRIFNPFYTTRATGTGLGLPIVHRLVEGHNGRIRAGNRIEGGARFRVWLPGRDTAGPRRGSAQSQQTAPHRRHGDESNRNETMAKSGGGVDRRADAPMNRRSAK